MRLYKTQYEWSIDRELKPFDSFQSDTVYVRVSHSGVREPLVVRKGIAGGS